MGDTSNTSGAVAAVGPPAEHLATKIRTLEAVQTAPLGEAATGLGTAQGQAGDSMASVRGAVGALDGMWEGSPADAFAAYMNDFAQRGAELDGQLQAVADVLSTLVERIEGCKREMATLGENFRREVEQLRAASMVPDQSGEAFEAAVQAKADAYAQQADRLIAQCNEDVQQAMGEVHALTSAPGPFSTLPPPSGESFEPRSEQPVTLSEPVSTAACTGGDGGSSNGSGGDGPGKSGGYVGSGGGGDPGSGSGSVGSGGGPPAGPPPGNVDQWIREAIALLQQNGYPVTEANIDQIWTIIEHESGGDPNAINDWDSNAAAGTPSKGLMQTIDPTFDAHALPGHTDVWNPVDNIAAGVAYTYDRYGSLEQHPGIESMASGGGYQPY